VVQSTTASRTNDNSIVLIWGSSFESLTRRRSGVSQKALECYITKEMSVVLGSGVKSNFIPPVTYLHRSTNSEQLLLMIADRSSLPQLSCLLIKNISQKCSRDNRKTTLGDLHGWISMDMEWSKLVELDHPWYHGVINTAYD